MKLTISTFFLLFSLSAFAQHSNGTEGQEISLFGTHSNDAMICIPTGPANSLCADLTYFEAYAQQNNLFCGTGLTEKELREMSRRSEHATPVFSIIDLEGNLMFTSEVEMNPCETWTCGVTTNDDDNDSGVTPDPDNSNNDPVAVCGFGNMAAQYTQTKMCGNVCMEGLDRLQNGIFVAIFQTANGTVSKKFSITAN